MKEIKKYVNKRMKNLLGYLEKYKSASDSELLHHVRVELKKIKALLHMMDFCSKGFHYHKKYSPFKKIFQESGKIREIYLINKLLVEYEITGFEKEIMSNTRKENEWILDFKKNIPYYKKVVKKYCNYEESEKYYDKMTLECLKEYLIIKTNVFKKQVYPHINQNNLHTSRKIIKEIIYLSSINKKELGDINPLYDEIQNIIGSWHDKQMLMKLLLKKNFNLPNKHIEGLKLKCRIDIKNLRILISNLYAPRYSTVRIIRDQKIKLNIQNDSKNTC